MTTVKRDAIVPYSAEKFFALVDDIEAYPTFIPGCLAAKEHDRAENRVVATLTLGKGKLNYSFTTENHNYPFTGIEMRLKEGPFSHFEATWQFNSLSEEATAVAFQISFELKSKLLEATFGTLLNHLANTMVKAFCARAKTIYG